MSSQQQQNDGHQHRFPTLYASRTLGTRNYLAAQPKVDLSQELKLHSNAREREKYDNLADLYAIILSMEHLEKAYVRDAISANDYAQTCSRLIGQYKTALGLVSPQHVSDISDFLEQYQLSCPAAMNRFRIGVPATVEHSQGSGGSTDSVNSSQYIAQVVANFITLMDQVKLNMVAVDQLHPLMSDLLDALNKVSSLPPDFEAKEKIKTWLVILNGLPANHELDEAQSRQLLFDLDNSHSVFFRFLQKQ